MRRPAGRILEQPDRADAAIAAEIEPVVRAARHADQIAGLDFDGEDRLPRRMDVKQPAAFDDEADFVLVVPVLGVELVEHHVEIRRVREDVDDVGGDVAALRFQLVDLRRVARASRASAGASEARRRSRPARS